MFLNAARPLLAFSFLLGFLGVACGARTAVFIGDAGADANIPTPCAVDLDCATGDACAAAECREGTCVPLPVVVCNDQDACTDDSCDSTTGKCIFTPSTLDLDGDGYRSPKPGFAPGAPGSCGDDCDDRSAAAHPGGVEVCDGVDNDCNGKIDDGAQYNNVLAPVRVSSAAFDRANAAGLAFDGKSYGVTYSGHKQLWSSYFEALARDGSAVVPERPLADVNSETYAGPLLYNGSYYQSAWADARQDGNYEIYFNRYDSAGEKLAPDLRVTNARNFSLDPVQVWNGTQTLLVWDDRRFESGSQNDTRLFGQRIGFDGSLVGGNVPLTSAGVQAENPGMALGQTRVGIVFTSLLSTGQTHAKFFTTAPDLSDASPIIDLGGSDVQGASLVYAAGHFIVAWETYGKNYGPSIYGAVVDENGTVLTGEQPITQGATFARSFSLVSLGDRMLMIWADDHDGNYELYRQILDGSLNVLSARTRLTFTPSDTLAPIVALGPDGDVGVLYDDWGPSNSDRQSYFLSMSCAMPRPTTK